MSFTLQLRCWYCRSLFPQAVDGNTNTADTLVKLLIACPSCGEECAFSLHKTQLSDVYVSGTQAIHSLAEVPEAVLAKHVFGTRQPT